MHGLNGSNERCFSEFEGNIRVHDSCFDYRLRILSKFEFQLCQIFIDAVVWSEVKGKLFQEETLSFDVFFRIYAVSGDCLQLSNSNGVNFIEFGNQQSKSAGCQLTVRFAKWHSLN